MSIDALVWQAQAPLVELAGSFSQEVKVKKLALACLSAFTATLACAAVSATFVGSLPLSCSVLSIPLLGLSFVAFKTSIRLKDYEDLVELQGMKEEAKVMSFSELVRDHQGIEPILSHGIVDLLELRSKFLLQYEAKSLSQIMQDVSLSYVRKHNLMTKQHIRDLFYEEFSQKTNMYELYNSLEEIGFHELKRFEVISEEEYEEFESLLAKEEESMALQRASLLHLNSQFFGRRDSILADLERKEKQGKDALQKAHSQKNPTPFSVVRSLQGQLKAVQEEKFRVEQDESIGRDIQKEYDKAREENHLKYEERKKALQQKFKSLQTRFS